LVDPLPCGEGGVILSTPQRVNAFSFALSDFFAVRSNANKYRRNKRFRAVAVRKNHAFLIHNAGRTLRLSRETAPFPRPRFANQLLTAKAFAGAHAVGRARGQHEAE
jgi:hypothetical protein